MTLLAPRARRTRRLGEAQARVGLACGGAGGARLLAHPHMPASRATVLRLVTRIPMPNAPAPIRVGIDDWAIRKGSRYGTIVVDLDRHRVIDLLPDRTALTVASWLERHPGVELVARDRSTEYARGASLGTPQAQQVADRWHLLTNMRRAVERWLHSAHARLRNLPLLPGSAVRPARRDRAFARSTPELEAGAQSRMRWQAVYDEVRRRHAGGEPLLGIARALGLARATVRKYASVEAFPARLPHGAGPSLLDPHAAYLAGRIDEGCENAMALWREIRERGDPGTSRQGHRLVAERRTRPVRSGRPPLGEGQRASQRPGTEAPVPPAGQMARLLAQPPSGRDASEAAMVRAAGKGRTVTNDQDADAAADIAAWITQARSCDAPAIATFASGLEADIAAVRAALTEPWSSGQRKARSTDSSSSSDSRARCVADRDQRPRQRGDRGLGRIDRGISDPAALLRGRPALGDGNGAGRARGADGDGGAPLRRWSRPYPASASSRSASTWAARWSASRSSTRSITAS